MKIRRFIRILPMPWQNNTVTGSCGSTEKHMICSVVPESFLIMNRNGVVSWQSEQFEGLGICQRLCGVYVADPAA